MNPIDLRDAGYHELVGNASEAGQWAGVFLIAGFITFLVGAALWKPGEYEGDLSDALAAFHRDAKRLRWIHSWMMVGTVCAVIGVSAFREMEAWNGETLWPSIGQSLWIIAATVWTVTLVWRMTVLQDAAARSVEAGSLPEGVTALNAWAGWVFWMHLMLHYLATVFLGFSIVDSASLPVWIGWAGAGFGTFMLLGNAARISVFQPPILVHLWPLVLGIVILIEV